ncbi:PIR Superfamily Protein [Plasmodium ovale wallikeri]|uniref:PIR Superfamily Protein n=2 Tax=Plasmodium ovale TaxID=36330 RepID=A0A1A9AQ18_PLAOA|nr:PIR Superfamily Protein [Plasmodium ovale wallikeri]SBT58196.1 PIR Superfamily Protein [Plasmodium ovale wallikeri]SBT72677.1 PIR protein [Plasmodium ovale]
MVSTQQDGEYFFFEEYNQYKSKLNDSYTFVDEEDEYQAFFSTVLTEDTKKHDEILNNCYIVKKYLLNFIIDPHCNNGKCCSYMNYWLNEKMRKNKNSLVESDFDVYNNYIAYYNNRNNVNVCESNKFLISADIFDEMKRLYSLYELYNTFIASRADSQSGCRNLNVCVTYYNKILRKCKHNSDNKFCKALQNFKNIFSTDNFVSLRECEKKLGKMKLKDPQDLPELDSQQVDLHLLQLNRESAKRRLLESSLHSQQIESTEGGSESIHSSFSHSNLIQTLFFSAFGISLLFLLSYKFTPFGKWMRSILLRKNIIKHYETKEETLDILSHTNENTNIDTEDSIHNIQYYATQIS